MLFSAGPEPSPRATLINVASVPSIAMSDMPAMHLTNASLSTLPVTFNSNENATASAGAPFPSSVPATAPAARSQAPYVASAPEAGLSDLPVSFTSVDP